MRPKKTIHDKIIIRGARQHNLQNLNVEIPRDKLVVITGLSGSGKSSLAFDTIYAEGQRRYVESLSAYARQFLEQTDKPDVDYIEGLSPAISIEQKTTHRNPRSTVGTVTEIYDYLRLLFARIGIPHCYKCGKVIESQTPQSIVDGVLAFPEGTRVQLLAPVIRQRKGTYQKVIADVKQQGFVRVRVDNNFHHVDDDIPMERYVKHDIDVVVDRIVVKEGIQKRLTDSVETSLKLGKGLVRLYYELPGGGGPKEILQSEQFACVDCGIAYEELEPRMFSFNNPHGACPRCTGLGDVMEVDPDLVVPDHSLSILDGAIRPWSLRRVLDGMYRKALKSVCDHYKVSPQAPWKSLTDEFREIILYGSGEQSISFSSSGDHHVYETNRPFEGVIPNLERRYKDTDSNRARDFIGEYMSTRPCPQCKGSRLRPESRSVRAGGRTIMDVTAMSIGQAFEWMSDLHLNKSQQRIAERILKEIRERLGFLVSVGLNYLTLDRHAGSLSGGESQRIRLATQIGSGLVGVLYILDEPSIGLHQRDNMKLIATLERLRDLGNTVIVVEHDEDTILAADHVLDLGPGAGVHGGRIVAEGTPREILKNKLSLTGQYLSGKLKIYAPDKIRAGNGNSIIVRGAVHNNLKKIDVEFPLGVFIAVTGVSGSGKSSLVNETLYPAVQRTLHDSRARPGKHDAIEGLEHIDKIIDIDQSPIGRTPRSNPATYTGLFAPIRDLFTKTAESRARGYLPGRFSFNVKGGRCEACEGNGLILIEMHFLPDVYVPCDECHGARYNRDTLEVRYKGKNIAEVLDMTVEDAFEFFKHIPPIARPLETLNDVGLSYIKLGQAATTLSGGEAQRVKLATELARRQTGRTLYILDEPTTGLHAADVDKLLRVLHRLADHGNTVIVIEHNLDVIATADWIIDLGPEGGDGGGKVIATGTPAQIAKHKKSYTGEFLKPKVLAKVPAVKARRE